MGAPKYQLSEESFLPLMKKTEQESAVKNRGRFYNISSAFMKSRPAKICAFVLLLIILMAILAPLSPYDPDKMDLLHKLESPSLKHPFGTDLFGRDYFTRALYGGRVSLSIAVFSMLISVFLGTVYGTVSGYAGGIVDSVMMRIVDILISIPSFLIIVMLNAVMSTGVTTMILVIGIFSWMDVARIVRAEALTLKSRDFVLAARGMGAGGGWIAFRHIISNAAPQIIVAASVSIGSAILIESTLSFLGFGVQLPMSSWGSMLQDAQSLVLTRPMMAVYPGVLILASVLSLNVLGDVVQKAVDPKQSTK